MYFKKIISVLLFVWMAASVCAFSVAAAPAAEAEPVADSGAKGDTIGEGDEWDDDEPVAALLGDVDGNGTVNVQDVTVMQQMTAEFAVSHPEMIHQRGDVDGDGSVTITDATLIRQYIAEYALSYPVGKPLGAKGS